MKGSKEQEVSDVVSEEVEEVTEPQPKKRRVLTEKQKEALARGRAKKLELNLLKKEAKKQPPPPPSTPSVSSASEEEEGVQEHKENKEPKPKKVKKHVVIRPVEDEDLDEELDALSDCSDDSVPEERPVLRRARPVYKKVLEHKKPRLPSYLENMSSGLRGHFFL